MEQPAWKTFIIEHKLPILTGALMLLLLVGTLISLNTPTSQKNKHTFQSSYPTTTQPILPTSEEVHHVHDEEILYEESSDLLKKEVLADGTTKYTLSSHLSSRPNIVIVKGEAQEHIFQRSVIPEEGVPILLSDYTTFFGPAEHVVKGSHFYGTNAHTYIYATQGMTYIADPQRNLVLELHTFEPMSVETYLSTYGNDN